MEKHTQQGIQIHTHHCQTYNQGNLIRHMIAIPVNQRKQRNKKKRLRKTRKITCQTHHRATILIRPTIVITDTNDARGREIRKKDPIKLFTRLTAKFLTIAYRSKII